VRVDDINTRLEPSLVGEGSGHVGTLLACVLNDFVWRESRGREDGTHQFKRLLCRRHLPRLSPFWSAERCALSSERLSAGTSPPAVDLGRSEPRGRLIHDLLELGRGIQGL
jgi:hypothetical protein